MITVTVEKRYGAATVRARVSAPTIERAVELASSYGIGEARVVFPIDGETFRAPVTREGIDFETLSLDELELALEAGLPGAYEAYLEALKDDLGEQGFEDYALENYLV
jgi:hypothetical protein